ncbi:eukaryotic translation initiation factor 4 gamma 1-like isoform X4 [Myxocyprinus asiaticus]|uniref:eukaryotic translation initiation factor 4 gamma 1-like isoform X4 n=1 Tax=Myxocyprinus asiaticus TaxID=70543 RepID=UPI002223A258|nr:eukaryotic translation initiation factor 4 gamma 1-like isoform X4 [Myxocyprinus asiaticus]
MNKPPQPITGPPAVPHPAQSPGLTPVPYPGQPPSVVFPGPSPQMNAAPQPRQFAPGPRALHQQQYYTNRPSMQGSANRVPPSNTTRSVGPTHVYQPTSQVMMIPPQQLPFTNTQGHAYFVHGHGQYRAPFMPPAQQYSVPSGTPGFYAGSSPAEYGTYDPSLVGRERRGGGGRGAGRENGRLSLHGAPLTSQRYPAAAYYPATQQYSPSVPPTSVMLNPAQQQPAPTPPQGPPQPPGQVRRERKPIRIRDPNQGGRDITEEIMSGGRTTSTPTPPQTVGSEAGSPVQTNGESVSPVASVIRSDDQVKPVAPPASVSTPPPSKTPEQVPVAPSAADCQPVLEVRPASSVIKVSIPSGEDPDAIAAVSVAACYPVRPASASPPPTNNSNPSEPQTGDCVDAPVVPEAPAQNKEPEDSSPPVEQTPFGVEKEEPEVAKEKESEPVASTEESCTAMVISTPVEALPAVANGSEESSEDSTSVTTETPVPEPVIGEPKEQPLLNGLPQDSAEVPEVEVKPECSTNPAPEPAAPQVQQICLTAVNAPVEEEVEQKAEEIPAPVSSCPVEETIKQAAATTVPKKKKKMKELNKKDVGDVLDAFKEPEKEKPAPEPEVAQKELSPAPAPVPPAEESEETWEEKEDKLDTENIKPETPKAVEQKYQYKEEQWKPINPEEKKQYDREFLLGFQFISASMHKPEGLPHISDVVLDKANKTPLRPLDPRSMMNCGPDFTPSYANLGRQSSGGGRGPHSSQSGRRPQPGRGKEQPRNPKIITSVSIKDNVELNQAENAWKPSVKKQGKSRGGEEEEDDTEAAKTQELFRRVRSVLNKLTPQMFQQLMKQVTELSIDTEERLKGVIDLIFEKAISEPNFSVAYANMCRCLMGLKVPTSDKPGVTVNFRKLLLNRCQKEFEKDKDDDEIFEQKQKELDASTEEEERQRLKEELEDAKDKARRRSLGNIKFIGELFKLKMLTEPIMHDCIVKLLKNHDEESLECLCRLLSTIGKDLDFEKAKPRMDQYFNQMGKIIKEKKTSSRIRFMLQDVLDLRQNNWVPRRGDQGPKTIDQIHKEAEMEEHREQAKVQQQLLSKKDSGQGRGGRGGPHSSGGRGSQTQDEGWNIVPITTKNRPIDTSRLSKITKPGDFNNQLLAPGGKGSWGSWGKGSSGGTGAKSTGDQDQGRPATSTLNRFSALQQSAPSSSSSSSADSDRRVPQRSSSSRDRNDRDRGDRDRGDRDRDRFERFDSRREDRDRGLDRPRPALTKRSFSRENEERRGGDSRGPPDSVRRVSSMTENRDRGSRERERSKETGERTVRNYNSSTEELNCKHVRCQLMIGGSYIDCTSAFLIFSVKPMAAPPPPAPANPTLSEDELDKKSKAIIEEYLHISDTKEAVQCVQELNSAPMLFVFVRNGVESTLERSTIAREHIGQLFQKLVRGGILPAEQYHKGLQEILEIADDMAIDIPHIWHYLAEIITPMLQEGGIPMGQLFREVSKPLLPIEKAAVLLVEILNILCKGISHKKAGAMWLEAGLSWKDFLPEDEDVNKFVTEKNMEFTLGEESEMPSKKELTTEELSKHLDRLFQDKANNQRINDWVEANLEEEQINSNQFVRALMMAVCQSAVICENPYKVDVEQINLRSRLLLKYLYDESKELQALYALQALMVQMEQPANLLRMFFDALYDEDVIKEETFYKWESSKDPAEQLGKGVALKSVTAFFTWLREAEDESDNNS